MRSFLETHNANRIAAYSVLSGDLKEHYGIEQTVLAGGYGYRQVMELIQNGADAILEAYQPGTSAAEGGRIHVLLREGRLYVANTGAPLTEEGLEALLSSHSSPKRGNQIGRFGLGFKSLLRLDGKIDFFTRKSGAVRFDPERCREELRRKFGVNEVPALRLAWPLGEEERATDIVLSELTWAETIVRAERANPDFIEELRKEIRSFPAEFLLFLPVSVTLDLDDGAGPPRQLRIETEGSERKLYAGEEQTRWRVMEREVRITDERARADATHIHARDLVPLAWAIPLEGRREEAGRFWAFFQTHTPTYMPGIINAPWKLNSDRNAIIRGDWNRALMLEAVHLIVEMLPQLRTDDDPGRPLDAFPRQLDRKDEDAAPLVEAVWDSLKTAAVIPDATGSLRTASELWRHPRENAELARRWQALAGGHDLARMVHPSCLERQRDSRLKVLAVRVAPQNMTSSPPNLRVREIHDWFTAVASPDVERAIEVLKLAEAYQKDCKPEEWNQVRPRLAIILCDDKQLRAANQVVFAPEGSHIPDGRHPVARALCEVAEAKRILTEVMKVKPLDNDVWLQVLFEALPRHDRYQPAPDEQWRSFWTKLRVAPASVRQQLIEQESNRIRVRRRDGEWVLSDDVLLPGQIVASDDNSLNQDVLIDLNFHGMDSDILKALVVSDIPNGDVTVHNLGETSNNFKGWLWHWRDKYRYEVNSSARWFYLEPFYPKFPKGWAFLPKLAGTPNAKLTKAFLLRIGRGEFPEQVEFGHSTVQRYLRIDASNPLLWFLLTHGMVQIGEATVRLTAVVARHQEPALAKLSNLVELQSALVKLQGTIPQVNTTDAEIRDLWVALIKSSVTPQSITNDSLYDLWMGAAKDGVVPDVLPTESGETPLSEVFVTGSSDLAQRARNERQIVVVLDDNTQKLWIQRGARNVAELMKPAFQHQTGPDDLLVSIVPEIGEVLWDEAKRTARCKPVSGLKLVIAGNDDILPCLIWENILLLDLGQLASLSRADRLQRLLNELGAAGWLMHKPEEALRILGDAQVDELRAKVSKGSTLAERLLLAVGNHPEPLRKALGDLAEMEFIEQCSPLSLAKLILAQLGPTTLPALKDALEAEGLKPPLRWNSAEARAFVASIGFPPEFATSVETRREPELFISGPIELPKLHDFQEEVLKGIQELLMSGTSRRRAVISLPTGAGKTLVTVEAAVWFVLAPPGGRRSVLWIAQTDELCEQAVQVFRQVWLNLGAQNTNLRIVRLWGGNRNPSVQEVDKPIVVVASIQTLNSRMAMDDLAWLQNPGLVVVDECHHAIAPSYTNLLRWLDAEAPRPGTPPQEEPPILGLSATPFRTDDEESRRLARRFDNRWFPGAQEDLHYRLRDQGILAQADYEPLESGVSLLPEELEQLSKLIKLPEGIDLENWMESINQRLSQVPERNELLVERIRQAEEHSILFFANSVGHAMEMSARLNLNNIPAAAVSGDTLTSARRYFLEHFQQGEIRVLCNHTILSTGFDAPKTDMILIARQVFSPVRFMQMVGRGLRGPKNGGTERCRIVSVIDNLGRFHERHPYHYCKQYFVSS